MAATAIRGHAERHHPFTKPGPRDLSDLKNPKWIWTKGVLFLGLGVLASGMLLWQAPRISVALLLAIAIWAFCRSYYFAFYVVEHYVDGQFRFAGLFDFARYAWRQWNRLPPDQE